jgi:hypothetical protein
MCSGAARRARGDLPTGGVIPLTSRGLSARRTARFGARPVLLAGLVSGLFNTTQQVGAAAGVALLSAIAAARTGQLRAAGQLPAAALTGGYDVAFGIGAALAALALIIAAIAVPGSRGSGPAPAAGRRPAAAG